MRALLLGTAAGGGFPQWNCACPACLQARCGADGVLPRTQDCLAVSANGHDWYLVNASPDIRSQLVSQPALAPGPGRRETPVRGVLLTDAELDHTLGLFVLRDGDGLPVWSTATVRRALTDDLRLSGVLARYGQWRWNDIEPGEPFLLGDPGDTGDGRLRVTPIEVSGKRPKYASPDPDAAWVVAYRFDDPATGGALVYAPCLAQWPAELDRSLDGVRHAVIDGTFYSAEELSSATGSAPDTDRQRAMGHVPVAGPDGTLSRVAACPQVHWVYTHLNNTNPLLDPHSPAAGAVRAAGVDVAADGDELTC